MFEYTILEDEVKSDFAFEVIADSLEELFKGAALATMKAMVDPEKVKLEKEWRIEIQAADEKMLLYDFLDELVYLKDRDTALFGDFDITIKRDEEIALTCVVKGSTIDWKEDILFTDVKAITMYEFKVEQRREKWYCHVILDL
ncbi:MAG: archease [Candidatus Heimdallarchaeaceae archaeon]